MHACIQVIDAKSGDAHELVVKARKETVVKVKRIAKKQAMEALAKKDAEIASKDREIHSLRTRLLLLETEQKNRIDRDQRNQQAELECQICLDNPSDTTFVPCGHSCCAGCLHEMTRRGAVYCPFCRVRVRSSVIE